MTTTLELFSVSVAIALRLEDYCQAFESRPVFIHVSTPFIARYGRLTELCGCGVLVDPMLPGLAFYLRREQA